MKRIIVFFAKVLEEFCRQIIIVHALLSVIYFPFSIIFTAKYSQSDSEFVVPLAGLLESFTLLLVDFAKTFTSHLACLSICHTEDIISLNSPINTTVAWDWLSEWQDLFVLLWWSNLEESMTCFILSLRLDNLLASSNQSLTVILLSIQISLFLNKSVLWNLSTVKCILLGSENWLLKINRIR